MLPLILGAIALGSAAFGIATGVSGVMDINEAQAKGKKAEAHYNRTKRELDVATCKHNRVDPQTSHFRPTLFANENGVWTHII
jgi:predicted lipase